MKKEFIYISVPVILCLFGLVYKSMFLSDTINDTRLLIDANNELSAKLNRDTLVQNNIKVIKKIFQENKRDSRTYGEVIADLMQTTETLLQQSEIIYRGNDINQDFDEKKDLKNGISSFFITVNFSTEYKKLKLFLNNVEQSPLLINIIELNVARSKVIPDKNSSNSYISAKGLQFDEFNIKSGVDVKVKLEFVKFL